MAYELKIGFLGAGKMALALAQGFVKAGLTSAERIVAGDPLESARAEFARVIGCKVSPDNLAVFDAGQVIILAVKPDHVESVLSQDGFRLTEKHLLISIAAGVPLAKLEGTLRPGARVIRVMPNTPALVGASATAYALGRSASETDGQIAQKLFSSVGLAYEVKEGLMDAVTGLSGSGPAYAYLMIEALSDGGVAAGLPRDIATRLAAQTLLGSAKMVLETGLHPGALKDMVTSPGGTTIVGLHELERGAVRGAFIQAVRVAAEKSRKLGQR
jgi:pyrroline-5-carboxylate reductase